MTVTKADLAAQLVGECATSKAEAKQIVEAFFEEVLIALESGERVKLAGFGVFSLRVKRPRVGRNPKTGEEKTIEARRVVSFCASNELKDRVDRKRLDTRRTSVNSGQFELNAAAAPIAR